MNNKSKEHNKSKEQKKAYKKAYKKGYKKGFKDGFKKYPKSILFRFKIFLENKIFNYIFKKTILIILNYIIASIFPNKIEININITLLIILLF